MTVRDPSAAEVEDRDHAPAGWRRRQRLALIAGVVLIAVLAGLWIERRPIATHVIDDRLAASGVPARYRIADLAPGHQRLTDVVIGDPAHPDLVADWIETETGIGLGGPALTGVRAGRVRVRGRLVDGRLSLGAIDRLLSKGNGTGGLPALVLDIADARLRLETPVGVVGASLTGRGRLDDGFAGKLALSGASLGTSGCTLPGWQGVLRVTTRRGSVGLTGLVAAERAACGTTRLAGPRLMVDAVVDPSAATWRGRVQITGGALADPRGRAASVAGMVAFDGRAGSTTGTLALAAENVAMRGVVAGRVSATGNFALGARSSFDGTLGVIDAGLDAALVSGLRQRAVTLASTPVGPLAMKAATALDTAARSVSGVVDVGIVRDGGGIAATISHAALRSRSGAVASFDGTATLAGAIDGGISIGGGDLPAIEATVRRVAGAAPVAGTVTMRPYFAGGAALALAPAAFSSSASGEMRLATVATLSGPLGNGRIDHLVVPLTLRRDAKGSVLIDEGCAPVSFDRLATGGLRLDPTRLTLCPVDGALVRVAANGAIAGGGHIGAFRLSGRLGTSPLALDAAGASFALATQDFTFTGIAAALGSAGRQTRLAAATLTGTFAQGGVAGSFAGAGGRIGAVPLVLSAAAGKWRFAGGALVVDGALTVADADAAVPRFKPLAARDVALHLVTGRITATGTLAEPTTGTRVAGLTIAHDLTSGIGHADLSFAKLSFKPGFQPDLLTPITRGVIADVAGTIDGDGHIAWSEAGVTSTGRFATAGTDLAAAFGPVTGIAGSIAFTDLLGLVSAPGQVVTVASINPGVVVENGTITFHTEPGVKVAVESARWPFAGGVLTLDPTLLDFSAPAERHMTFHLDGVAADRFLQQFDFKNLAATGTFDGVLPMVFDASGGRIEQGRLTVREGGGGIAYVGDLTQKELGFWGNLAFEALKSLRYRNLSILMNGPLEGEIITEVRFAGVSQGQGAKSNFLIRRLQRLPFVFNVRIKAPFRALLDGLDPSKQAELHLKELIDRERAPVQPPVSGTVP